MPSQIKLMQLSGNGELVDARTGQKGVVGEGTPDERKQAWNDEMDALYKWNLNLGMLHLVQATAQFSIALYNDKGKSFVIPVTSIFCNWDGGYPVQQLELQHSMVLLRYVAMFSFLSAAAHFNILWQWEKYVADLKLGLNRFRWWEYSISGSLIMTLLFQLWGNLDWVQATGCLMLNFCCCLFGDCHEVVNSGKKPSEVNWTMFLYGALCGALPWVVMFYEMARIPASAELPWWVWLAVGEYLVLFGAFPYTLVQQYRQKGKFNNDLYPLLENGGYLKGEKQYMLLSLFTKSLLAWQIAGAIVGPDTDIWDQIDDNLR